MTDWHEKLSCHTENERLVTAFGEEEQGSAQLGAAAAFSANPWKGPPSVPSLAGPEGRGSATHGGQLWYLLRGGSMELPGNYLNQLSSAISIQPCSDVRSSPGVCFFSWAFSPGMVLIMADANLNGLSAFSSA